MTSGRQSTMSSGLIRRLDVSGSVEDSEVVVMPLEADERLSHIHVAGGAQPGHDRVTDSRIDRNQHGASPCA